MLVFAIEVRPFASIVDAYRDSLPELVERAEDHRTRSTLRDAVAASAPWHEVRDALTV
jgi:hypothetical protein